MRISKSDRADGGRPYRLLTPDEIAEVTNEIVVSISADPLTGRLLRCELQWPERVADSGHLPAGWKVPALPTSVPATLLEADILAVQMDFAGVVISMDPVLDWDPDWGDLAED